MLAKLFSRRQIFAFIQGIASGLPLLMTLGTLQAWMKDAGVDLGVIGLMSSVTLPYSLKFLWAPLLDRYTIGKMGRRRGHIFVLQLCLAISMIVMGQLDPSQNLSLIALSAFVLTFFSSSLDIVVDAYRREILPSEELGLGSSMYVTGYRIGMLLSGALALHLAQVYSEDFGVLGVWKYIYGGLGVVMAILAFVTFLSPKEDDQIPKPVSLKESIVGPFVEFFKREGAFEILFFIVLYKVGDSMASAMTTPFILDIGFTKSDLASVAKIWGMMATILGGIIGGTLIIKLKINRSLWLFGALQAISTAGFAFLATVGNSMFWLTAVVAFENLASGMGTAAYAAFMASQTNKKFTATQYALLSSLMAIPRTMVSAPTGYLAQTTGWSLFFMICAVAAVPGMLMLLRVAPLKTQDN